MKEPELECLSVGPSERPAVASAWEGAVHRHAGMARGGWWHDTHLVWKDIQQMLQAANL